MRAHYILVAAAAMALAACGEKTQTVGQDSRKDGAAFQGTGSPFAAPGWKAGDKTSWEQQLKTRLQMGQNDYAKVN
jgi:predicted small secreted protein